MKANEIIKTKTLNVSFNYFGDTVLTFSDSDEDYNMFQYNCMGARELLKRVVDLVLDGYNVFVVEEVWQNNVQVFAAVPYIQRIIKLNDDVAELERTTGRSFASNGPGAEIAAHYGY